MTQTRLIAIVLALLWFTQQAIAQPATPAPNYASEAREVTEHLQKVFYDPKTGVYVKTPKDRTPDYVWRQAAVFSAFVAAAAHEPAVYRPVMTKYFHALINTGTRKPPSPPTKPAPTRRQWPR